MQIIILVTINLEIIMFKFLILFLTGAVGYSMLEIIWRGYTHWSMFVLGGICFYILYHLFSALDGMPVIVKALAGGGVITAAEFISGYILNIRLHLGVWNYSSAPFNLMGQICLTYSLLWAALCIPLSYLCAFFKEYI